ncbi:hypothetical protein BTN45_24880 [Rhizobium sp. ZX09]|nr:hypothetical protein BTN45_24880 [Rhizobium sp. ZX09]
MLAATNDCFHPIVHANVTRPPRADTDRRERECRYEAKVSGGAMSRDCRAAHDTMLGLMKTRQKLGPPSARADRRTRKLPAARQTPEAPDRA